MSFSPTEYWATVVSHGQSVLHLKISQITEEIAPLLDLATKQGPINSTLEIGSQDGGTLWLAIQMLELDGHAFTIDLPNGPFGGVDSKALLDTWKGWVKSSQTLDAVFGDSHQDGTKTQLIDLMKSRGVEKFDFAFIDGDHSYEGVKSDFEKYSPLVRPGGIVAFHDVAIDRKHPEVGVNKFWTELKAKYPAENIREFVENVDQDWAGIAAVII